jgi:hypothetical protein
MCACPHHITVSCVLMVCAHASRQRRGGGAQRDCGGRGGPGGGGRRAGGRRRRRCVGPRLARQPWRCEQCWQGGGRGGRGQAAARQVCGPLRFVSRQDADNIDLGSFSAGTCHRTMMLSLAARALAAPFVACLASHLCASGCPTHCSNICSSATSPLTRLRCVSQVRCGAGQGQLCDARRQRSARQRLRRFCFLLLNACTTMNGSFTRMCCPNSARPTCGSPGALPSA